MPSKKYVQPYLNKFIMDKNDFDFDKTFNELYKIANSNLKSLMTIL